MQITERKKPEVTVNYLLEKRKIVFEDKHPIKLRITHQRKSKYYTIKGHAYTKAEYTKIIEAERESKWLNKLRYFRTVQNRAIDIIDNKLNQFTFEAFEAEYLASKKYKNKTIQDYFESKAQDLEKAEKLQTAILYRATIKSLERFDKKISFQKITPTYLKKYENWFVTEGKTQQKKLRKGQDPIKKGGSYTTVGIYMRNIKAIINQAKQNIAIEYPFGKEKGKYQIPDANNKKKAFTINDIDKLFKYQPNDRNEFLALNYWLFSYLCNGMNMADIANLKYSKIKHNNIEFIREKTKDTTKDKTFIRVLLQPEINDIISKLGNKPEPDNYIFPIYQDGFNANDKLKALKQHIKQTNKYIKRIAKNVGINENCTTYWARYSYSTILKRSGAPVEFISEQLGHSDTKVTQNYLDSFEDEQRAKYSANLIPNKDNE